MTNVHIRPAQTGLSITLERPEQQNGVDGFATATVVVPDGALRTSGPTRAADRVMQAFISQGFYGPAVRHDIEAALRARLQCPTL